jgi:peptidoglycan-associated lipoprotein
MTAPRRIALRSVPAFAMLSLLVIGGCRKKPQPAPEPAPTPAAPVQAATIDSAAIRDSIARARAAEAEAARRAREDSIRLANERASAEQTALRNALTAVIYFDFDQADLRDDARAALDAKIPVLSANSGVGIRIAGHTDERGSTEYNLALAQRRAATAKRYLVEHGIAENRIETVSFGEERPVAQGSDESAWSQNRRDEFEITAGGGGRLTPPRR